MTVAMQHEGIEAMAFALDEDQFLLVWRPRGWERLPEVEAFASVQVGRLIHKAESDLTIDELITLGAVRGGEEVARTASKAKHFRAFADTFDNPLVVEPETPDDAVVVDEKVATPASSKHSN